MPFWHICHSVIKIISIFHFHYDAPIASVQAIAVRESTHVRPTPKPVRASTWRTPLVIVLCGCVIAMLAFGPRSSVGQFLTPMSLDFGWGREVFSLALAIQNLLWGVGQPFAGAIADRFGTIRVLCGGAMLYALGLALMAYSQTPGMLHLSAGVLIGFGLSGCSFNLVIGAFGKLVPENMRGLAFGAGTAAGSFGQFLFSPLARALIDHVQLAKRAAHFRRRDAADPAVVGGARNAARRAVKRAAALTSQSVTQALSEAFGHRSYVLLVLGFFTCGFQLAFVTVHLPAYLVDRGLSAQVGAWTIGAHRPVQHRRLADVRLALQPHAEAIHSVGHLFHARGGHRRVHHRCR